MEGSDRITIRLEPEILARMESFLEGNPRFGSRSHLCRIAVDQFLEAAEGSTTRVTVELPPAYLEFVDALVTAGYFLSREDGIKRLVEEGLSRDRVNQIVEHQEAMGRATGKIFPVRLERRDTAEGP